MFEYDQKINIDRVLRTSMHPISVHNIIWLGQLLKFLAVFSDMCILLVLLYRHTLIEIQQYSRIKWKIPELNKVL